MTTQAQHGLGTGAERSLPPADSFHLVRAEDGSVLLVMPGSGIAEGREVSVSVEKGVLSVSQAGDDGRDRVLVRAPVDADGRAFLACLPSLQIVEVYPGPTEDDNRIERFPDDVVALTYEGRVRHG